MPAAGVSHVTNCRVFLTCKPQYSAQAESAIFAVTLSIKNPRKV